MQPPPAAARQTPRSPPGSSRVPGHAVPQPRGPGRAPGPPGIHRATSLPFRPSASAPTSPALGGIGAAGAGAPPHPRPPQAQLRSPPVPGRAHPASNSTAGPGPGLRRASSLPSAPPPLDLASPRGGAGAPGPGARSLARTASAAPLSPGRSHLSRFEISTEKPDYQEGEVVRGSVWVQVAPAAGAGPKRVDGAPLPGPPPAVPKPWPQAEDIALFVDGSERVSWSNNEIPLLTPSGPASPVANSTSFKLIQARVPLDRDHERSKEVLPPGLDLPTTPGELVEFPFYFQLPDDLTPTFRATEAGLNGVAYYSIEVAYRLEARLGSKRATLEFGVVKRPSGTDPDRACAHFTASAQSFCRCLAPYKLHHMEASACTPLCVPRG
eukprot:tig00000254_g22521.t1